MPEQQQLILNLPQQLGQLRNSKKKLQNLPPIPDKLYFTIGEVSDLCFVKPHVLRYWEQEFPQLSPAKRRGNRRYYQRNEVVLVRRIKNLLYEQGFTIEGARAKLSSVGDDAVASGASVSVTKATESIVSQLNAILSDLERN